MDPSNSTSPPLQSMEASPLWFDGTKLRFNIKPGQDEDLLQHVLSTVPPGDPKAVIAAVDKYTGSSPNFFMHIGDVKGTILDKEVEQCDPISVLELGAFCGYSAVRIASLLRRPGSQLISVEPAEQFQSLTRQMVAHAGLSDKVAVVAGTLQTALEEIKEKASKVPFDFVLIDHVKDLYLSDLLFLQQHKLIGPGSVVFADNVGFPGAPDYMAFMEKTKDFETERHETSVGYSTTLKDVVLVSKYRPHLAT